MERRKHFASEANSEFKRIFEEHFDRFVLNPNYVITAGKIQSAMDYFTSTYSSADAGMLRLFTMVATVAHQYNDYETSRFRKVPGENNRVIPYIEHPLEIALANAGKEETLYVWPFGRRIEIPVQQRPANPLIVAASLLHDVIEDTTFEGIQNSDWYDVFGQFLSVEKADELSTIIESVTKYPRDEVRQELLERIENQSLYRSVVANIRGKSQKDSLDDVETQVGRTLLDVHKMFTTCFGNSGQWIDDPDALRTFYAAFAVKTQDVANNLKTEGTRPDKLMRAHIFAVMARVLGYPVASRLGLHLIMDNQYSLNTNPYGQDRKAELELVKKYGEEEQYFRHHPLTIHTPGSLHPILTWTHANQIPIITLQEQLTKPGNVIRPAIQYLCYLENPKNWQRLANSNSFTAHFGTQRFKARPIDADIQRQMQDVGRRVNYFELIDESSRDNRTYALLNVRDHQPTPYDTTKYNKHRRREIDPRDIPERLFFENFDGSVESTMEILQQFYPYQGNE